MFYFLRTKKLHTFHCIDKILICYQFLFPNDEQPLRLLSIVDTVSSCPGRDMLYQEIQGVSEWVYIFFPKVSKVRPKVLKPNEYQTNLKTSKNSQHLLVDRKVGGLGSIVIGSSNLTHFPDWWILIVMVFNVHLGGFTWSPGRVLIVTRQGCHSHLTGFLWSHSHLSHMTGFIWSPDSAGRRRAWRECPAAAAPLHHLVFPRGSHWSHQGSQGSPPQPVCRQAAWSSQEADWEPAEKFIKSAPFCLNHFLFLHKPESHVLILNL